MRIIRFNENGNCQFFYFNWRKFKFETSCWAQHLGKLLGSTRIKSIKSIKFIEIYTPTAK